MQTHSTTFVALFPDRNAAREARRRLRDAGVADAWVGRIVGLTDATFGGAAGADGLGAARVIDDEPAETGPQRRALYDELVRRGVDASLARETESVVDDGDLVVVAGAADASIETTLREAGGRVVQTDDLGAASAN